jgi:DNA replication protein DnaC
MIIPARYEKCKYEDVSQNVRESFEKIRSTRKGMYIYGGVGSGKTHTIYALAKQTQGTLNVKTKFWNCTELLREIRMDFGRDNRDKKWVEETLLNFNGLLFLDDIGSEKMTEWVEETFYLIVNKRYNSMLPIIFTSNLPIEDLSKRIGDRITSRIVEMCDIFKLDGKDRRLG